MNTNQRNVLLTGTVTLLLMILFPPWQYVDGNTSDHGSMGFHFLSYKPPAKAPLKEWHNPAAIRVEVDVIRLAVQILAVAFLTVASLLLLMDKKTTVVRFLGQTLLGVGLAALIFYILIWVILANK